MVTDTTTTLSQNFYTSSTTRTTVVATAVVPTKYRKKTMPQPRPQSSPYVMNNPLRIVTAGGLLGVAILGGQQLGNKLLQPTTSNYTTQQDQDDDDDKNDAGVTLPKSTTVLQKLRETSSSSNNNTDNLNDDASSTQQDGIVVDRQEIGRQMVQKILKEQENKTALANSGATNQSSLVKPDNNSVSISSPYLPFPSDGVTATESTATATTTTTTTTTKLQPTTPRPKPTRTLPKTRVRSQPLPVHEELALQNRYAAIPDLSERAYQILIDLGMV
jgi:hypothetical protein